MANYSNLKGTKNLSEKEKRIKQAADKFHRLYPPKFKRIMNEFKFKSYRN